MQRIFALLSLLCLGTAVCLCDDSAQESKVTIPESSFISAHRYTNAFFGFSLSIPRICRFQIFDQKESNNPLEHFLLGERCPEKALTSFGINATPSGENADNAAQKAVLLPTMGPRVVPEKVSVGGRPFWKNTLEEKTLWGQKVWRAQYATVSRGFVLVFWMSSYSSKFAADLRQAFESIEFFEPSRATQMADTDSHPYLPETARQRVESTPGVNIAELDAGKLLGNLYVHRTLGFSYQFPQDWIHSPSARLQTTAQTSDDPGLFSGSESSGTAGQCVRILTSFTRYDENDRRLDFNPRVSILAANPTCFIPDLTFPASLEDNESVKSYGEALVHSLVGTRLIGRQKIKLFGIGLNDHIFVEITSSNAEPVAGGTLLRKIYTDMILTRLRDAWIIWLFESDAEAEFATVLKSSISFAPDQAVTSGNRR